MTAKSLVGIQSAQAIESNRIIGRIQKNPSSIMTLNDNGIVVFESSPLLSTNPSTTTTDADGTIRSLSSHQRIRIIVGVGMALFVIGMGIHAQLLDWNNRSITPLQHQSDIKTSSESRSLDHSINHNGHFPNGTNSRSSSLEYEAFPSDFVWGVATSAYQIEGATREDGRGASIWDTFVRQPGTILDNSTGDRADDHYHLWKQDVALMQSLNIQAYRFSISWSRIYPTGRGEINPAGIRFYDALIDELLAHHMEPWITLFHWDLPQALQDDYGGWLDRRTVDAFAEYARTIYTHFGSKVRHFITLNEPWTFSVNGHGSGIHAPGRNQNPTTEPYIVAHNLLLGHARAYTIYKQEFATKYGGKVGIANCGDFRYPKSQSRGDILAAERAMQWQWGWFVDPITFGDYPITMRQRLGSRLPKFSSDEISTLIGSADFLGLNYYSSLIASAPDSEANFGGYWVDMDVNFSKDPRWELNDMGWPIVPDGLREMVVWIKKRYSDPIIYITENGSAEPEETLEMAKSDEKRRTYIQDHLAAGAEAIRQTGALLKGYFAWSLLDNFEWQFGYQRRFGICHVNFDTLVRTPKSSALWYRDTIGSHGKNIVSFMEESTNHRSLGERKARAATDKSIPGKVLMGYGSRCESVRQAVHDGVNIVTWSFLDVRAVNCSQVLDDKGLSHSHCRAAISTSLNLTDVRSLIFELRQTGFHDVLHFVSVGGWNGPHLDPKVSAREWYRIFNEEVGDIFDGIDWDLEGNDQMESPYNEFTLEVLNKMGEISRMAKKDGFFTSIAPPQSYLDINNGHFSRFVNLTDNTRNWHADFSYFGANVYAYILHKYGHWIDLISIQFYESYSKAGEAIYRFGLNPSEYLVSYIDELVQNQFTWFVNFTEDAEIDLIEGRVSLPLAKLVFGFANGWATTSSNDKAVFFCRRQIEIAWKSLEIQNTLPRGFMFWTINEEGRNGILYARDLSRILFHNSSSEM